jgi:hypothetical protein
VVGQFGDLGQAGVVREEKFYLDLHDVVGSWMPRFYEAFQRDDWNVLLLEDLGPKSVPPWRPAVTRNIVHRYADFHAATLGVRHLPDSLPRPSESLTRVTWTRVARESQDLHLIASLAVGEERAALDWLTEALPLLQRSTDDAANLPGPHALLHGDTRSDNLRLRSGRLFLFDWPSAEVGRPEFDLVAFAQSITVEGGVDPEQILAWYGERLDLQPEALAAAVAWITAFFADVAWRPEIPGLPRLRSFQRRQLRMLLPWAARSPQLPEPTWASTIP